MTTKRGATEHGRPDLVRAQGRRPAVRSSARVSASAVVELYVLLLGLLVTPLASAADLEEGAALFHGGRYAECVEQATAAVDEGVDERLDLEAWRRLGIEAELIQGNYAAALTATELALDEDPGSIPLRMLARRVLLFNDQPEKAAAQVGMIGRMALNARGRYWTPESRVALGRFYLEHGADARQVLEIFFDPVVKSAPDFVDAHLASAELALNKYDQALAADILGKAPEAAKENPQYHYLLARAMRGSDADAATAALRAALATNPRHIDSLLLEADQLIDAEHYDEAGEVLDKILAVNPSEPTAWAFKAVLANLAADEAAEATARERALAAWKTNPAVDHTIGRKLSDKYRFAEGAEHQRRALLLDASYLPARMQLAQDLLRLGEEQEGWRLATEAADADGYNVVAHNLATLHDSLSKYRVLANDSFRVRMEPREAAIYGPRALELLDRAKQTLCAKYESPLDRPITVDVFPKSQDFAVRTFGLPGAEGFLAVCFGNVITAKSAAALGGVTSNWESTLWHEFCHVATLRKSRNKMPRWLSEGISVYEERQANPAWGEKLTPEYREIVASGKAPAVSQLSGAFLAPENPLALQFAYFESSLVVEMLVEEYGAASINKILEDLGAGLSIEDALARNAAPVNRLDAQFETYLHRRVDQWAPNVTWSKCDAPRDADSAELAAWMGDHPGSYQGLIRLARAQQREKKWPDSLATARQLREIFPAYIGPGNAYELAARACRESADADAEREALEAWAQRDGAAADAYQRLMELGEQTGDWQAVLTNAQRMLAVNPLSPSPYRQLAGAAEELGQAAEADAAYQSLLQFDTADAVDVHYRLAVLLRSRGDLAASRRHALQAIEDAPRYLQALDLLLDVHAAEEDGSNTDTAAAASVTESGRPTATAPNSSTSATSPAPAPPATDPPATPSPADPQP